MFKTNIYSCTSVQQKTKNIYACFKSIAQKNEKGKKKENLKDLHSK